MSLGIKAFPFMITLVEIPKTELIDKKVGKWSSQVIGDFTY